MELIKKWCDYKAISNKIHKLHFLEKLFYAFDTIGLDLIVDIYGKDAVIDLIKKFPVVKVVEHIIDRYSLSISRYTFDVIDFFADKLVSSPYANLMALVTTKPELYLSNLRPFEDDIKISLDLADRLWDNLRFYVKRRPETIVEIFEETHSTIVRSYTFQALWLEGIKVDDSKLNYYSLDLKFLKINDEYVINVFLRNSRCKIGIMEDLYFHWKRINPYIIDYIMRTQGITREQVIREGISRKEFEERDSFSGGG
jgi:hypothetical protein